MADAALTSQVAEMFGPYGIIVFAAVPSILSAAWVAYDKLTNTQEKRDAQGAVRQKQVDDRADAVSKEATEFTNRVLADNSRLQVRCDRLEYDRDRGWDTARWWYREANRILHIALEAQSLANSLCVAQGARIPEWPDMTIERMEDRYPNKDLAK